jgi:dihydrofolate reductase (trimethoprim resistance protein)
MKFPDTHPTFAYGDGVKKISGSEWYGKVVGWYATELTPEGYAVESEAYYGAVQIYPAAALRKIDA